MKKIILSIIAVAMAFMPMSANRILETRGDTIIIAHEGDTLRFAGTQSIKELAGILDDTLINLNSDAEQVVSEGDIIPVGTRDLAIRSQEIWAKAVENVAASIMIGLAFLIAVILLFSYLKRRRKYKMVEKAIENNYPLPPYVFDGYSAPSNYTAPYTPAQPVQGAPIAQGVPVENAEPVIDENGEVVPPPLGVQNDPWQAAGQQHTTGAPRMNWRAFQGSFVLVAVGLGLMLMFHGTGLMGIFAILVLIGLGKGFIEYQDQRDAINAWYNKQ